MAAYRRARREIPKCANAVVQLLELDDDPPTARFALGLVHREKRALVEASSEAQKAIAAGRYYANARVLFGSVLYYAE